MAVVCAQAVHVTSVEQHCAQSHHQHGFAQQSPGEISREAAFLASFLFQHFCVCAGLVSAARRLVPVEHSARDVGHGRRRLAHRATPGRHHCSGEGEIRGLQYAIELAKYFDIDVSVQEYVNCIVKRQNNINKARAVFLS